jgi:splicing factor U2AF subunit
VREGSAERRAKIEQWNKEREQAAASSTANQSIQNGGVYSDQPDDGF